MKDSTKRATVYLDGDLHKALRVKAAHIDSTVSDLINSAVRLSLSEDEEDLAAFEERKHEQSIPLEKVLKKLKARGKI